MTSDITALQPLLAIIPVRALLSFCSCSLFCVKKHMRDDKTADRMEVSTFARNGKQTFHVVIHQSSASLVGKGLAYLHSHDALEGHNNLVCIALGAVWMLMGCCTS